MARSTRAQTNASAARPNKDLEAIERAVAASRLAQGLPAKCSDPQALAVILNVLRAHYAEAAQKTDATAPQAVASNPPGTTNHHENRAARPE